ncbi:hypothetical protein [Candidatus Nesciobacter abundans]|uniref:phenylalanine--tRNA ligase n=1 Tax=Candidatus Nesciobacter abundans TaxID=2601668 RepID=A0A5C0UFZ6_9PROT|nr:hypothetical protein [Candidatus Nesciobacter abundans]QEK39026.1 hypothetical protein FZC36_01075 [Candidatus Nesciobacter abundans]
MKFTLEWALSYFNLTKNDNNSENSYKNEKNLDSISLYFSKLKDFAKFEGKNYFSKDSNGISELQDLLVERGFEIESCTEIHKLNNLEIVEIIKIEKHPNADKLNLCTVRIIDKDIYKPKEKIQSDKALDSHNTLNEETFTIVCGANNVYVGMKTVLAKLGAIIPSNNMEIKKAKIRGIESSGMLCSSYELGLSDSDIDGILDLNIETIKDLNSIIEKEQNKANDYIFDIEVTPNRKDVTNVFGIAREITAGLGIGYAVKSKDLEELDTFFSSNNSLNIKTNDKMQEINKLHKNSTNEFSEPIEMQTYTLPKEHESEISRVYKSVFKISIRTKATQHINPNDANNDANSGNMNSSYVDFKPISFTPFWMQQRLRNVGIKITNNPLENLSNYVLHSYGYELFFTENHEDWNMILISGQNNSYDKKSSDNGSDIKKQKHFINKDNFGKLGINAFLCIAKYNHTDSKTFNDESHAQNAINFVTDFFMTYSNESFVEKFDLYHNSSTHIDVSKYKENRTEPKSSQIVFLNSTEVEDVTGFKLNASYIEKALRSFGFNIIKQSTSEQNNTLFEVEIPSWRSEDIKDDACLIEEIMRYKGVDSIEPKPMNYIPSKYNQYEDLISNFWTTKGFFEVFNNNFMESRDSSLTSEDHLVEIDNPMTSKQTYLRDSLYYDVLKIAKSYENNNMKCKGIFEIGKTFTLKETKENEKRNNNEHPANDTLSYINTKNKLCIAWLDTEINWANKKTTFHECNQNIENFFNFLGVNHKKTFSEDRKVLWNADHDSYDQTTNKATEKNNQRNNLENNGNNIDNYGIQTLGCLQEITTKHKKHFKIKSDVFFAEICLDSIGLLLNKNKRQNKVTYNTNIYKDFSFKLNSDTPVKMLLDTATELVGRNIKLTVFDIHPTINLNSEKKVGIRLNWINDFVDNDDHTNLNELGNSSEKLINKKTSFRKNISSEEQKVFSDNFIKSMKEKGFISE